LLVHAAPKYLGGNRIVAGRTGKDLDRQLLRPEEFLRRAVPAIIERLKAEAVDAVLLVPV
jgi:hypothetical protein